MLEIASRDIKCRALADDDGAAGLQGDIAAHGGELRGIPLDESRQPGHVTERGAHPVSSVIGSGIADVNGEAGSPQIAVTLQR